MLTGKEIVKQFGLGLIQIDPFDINQCNPNSYDYRLAPFLRILQCNGSFNGIPCIDPRLPQKFTEVSIPEEGYLLEVGKLYLGTTVEQFGSDSYPSLVTGKSSIGRLFVSNHITADHVDQGYFGHITLEITAGLPTLVFPRMRFGQIRWFQSIGECELYRGKYAEGNAAAMYLVHLDLGK